MSGVLLGRRVSAGEGHEGIGLGTGGALLLIPGTPDRDPRPVAGWATCSCSSTPRPGPVPRAGEAPHAPVWCGHGHVARCSGGRGGRAARSGWAVERSGARELVVNHLVVRGLRGGGCHVRGIPVVEQALGMCRRRSWAPISTCGGAGHAFAWSVLALLKDDRTGAITTGQLASGGQRGAIFKGVHLVGRADRRPV